MHTRGDTASTDIGKIPLIQGFEDLFASKTGIRKGASLLISGPPGSGKTTFALAAVRALMALSQSDSSGPITHGQKDQKNKKTIAYYISSEVDHKTLERAYATFGWFAKENAGNDPNQPFCFRMDDPSPDQTNFYSITPLPEVDRPVPSPEELVNGIFNRIARTLIPSETPRETARIYVIIDSISALLKGCANPGEERRQTHEILHRLRDLFGDDLILTILLAEQDHRAHEIEMTGSSIMPTSPSVEDYLADIVFRLYVRSLPLGRRSRVLEVVKSQGVNMILGEHSWQIITQDNFEQILRHRGMRAAIKMACLKCIAPAAARTEIEGQDGRRQDQSPPQPLKNTLSQRPEEPESTPPSWGGIIIFPRPRLQRTSIHGKEPPKDLLHGGPGTGGFGNLRIRLGTTTLIAGPVGSGKTTLCKQFLKATKNDHKPEAPVDRPVLISFDVYPSGDEDSEIDILDFTQTKFDLNVLVGHIEWILRGERAPRRMAFDGLSEWITMFDEPEAARMLEALMITVMRSDKNGNERRPPPAVFMTYALGLDENPLVPHALGMNAENIVVVRQIAINDQLRRIIYILKSDGGLPDPEVPKELIMKNREISVVSDTLDYYTGLLGRPGDIKPARVLLLLFAENDGEKKVNAQLYEALSHQHKSRLDITYSQFSRSEIGTTLDSVASEPSQGESASLKVQSVDEWWLGSEKTEEFLRGIEDIWTVPLEQPDSVDQSQAKNRALESVGWRDYWSFEVEKAIYTPEEKQTATAETVGLSTSGIAASNSSPDKCDPAPLRLHAVPAYMDFGMFCINYYLWLQYNNSSQTTASSRRDWVQILSEVPRLWAREKTEGDFEWFQVNRRSQDGPGQTEPETILEYALRLTNQMDKPLRKRKPVFTFDLATRETCVCTFLEFAWAFGARENLLAGQDPTEIDENKANARKALTFLQFMVLEGLMPERGAIDDATDSGRTFFSRHFYSTLTKHQEEGNLLIALPFMPTGIADRFKAMASALRDIRTRLRFWTDRVSKLLSVEENTEFASDLKAIESWLGASDVKAVDERVCLNEAIKCYTLCRGLILKLASRGAVRRQDTPKEGSGSVELVRSTPGLSSNIDDLIELTTWAALRLQLLIGRDGGCFPLPKDIIRKRQRGLAAAMDSVRNLHQHLPHLKLLKKKDKADPVWTGYGCTGSWMYGVSKKSRAPALQAQILREMTSLDWAVKRAKSEGGMPARKDFFHLHGGEEVPGMEYLNWREFLRYNGSRARRRDRVLSHKGKAHAIYTLIHRELLASLRVAGLHKEEYAKDSAKRRIVATMSARTKDAVDAIFDFANKPK